MNEIWEDIDGYGGDYQVSNFGRVKSFKHRKPLIMKPGVDAYGYPQVGLCRNNKHNSHKIHRLVAMAFIPNPLNKPEINHIDGCKSNNHVDNLEWVTAQENSRHAYATGLQVARQGEDGTTAKLTNKQAEFIRNNPDGLTCRQLAKMFGVAETTIGLIQRGKSFRNVGGVIRDKFGVPEKDREKIRREYVYGSHEFGARALARKYGVSHRTILNIVHEVNQ